MTLTMIELGLGRMMISMIFQISVMDLLPFYLRQFVIVSILTVLIELTEQRF
jgi:hypothetical protein